MVVAVSFLGDIDDGGDRMWLGLAELGAGETTLRIEFKRFIPFVSDVDL